MAHAWECILKQQKSITALGNRFSSLKTFAFPTKSPKRKVLVSHDLGEARVWPRRTLETLARDLQNLSDCGCLKMNALPKLGEASPRTIVLGRLDPPILKILEERPRIYMADR